MLAKFMKNLGVASRLAIVLTIAFVVIRTGVIFTNDSDNYSELHSQLYFECRESADYSTTSIMQCDREATENAGERPDLEKLGLTFLGVTSVTLVLWMLVIGLIWLPIRWILAGRNSTS